MQVRGLVYPTEFPVKLFIRPDLAVERRLLALVRSHLPEQSPLNVERRASAKGNYLCLTLTFVAQDEDHLLRITTAVRADPGVVLSL
jgi:putative lipoic acid-binding regulatory protein